MAGIVCMILGGEACISRATLQSQGLPSRLALVLTNIAESDQAMCRAQEKLIRSVIETTATHLVAGRMELEDDDGRCYRDCGAFWKARPQSRDPYILHIPSLVRLWADDHLLAMGQMEYSQSAGGPLPYFDSYVYALYVRNDAVRAALAGAMHLLCRKRKLPAPVSYSPTGGL